MLEGIDLRAAGMAAPGSLKFQAQCYCAETQSKLPAMVAAVVNLEGRHIATHRTYLRPTARARRRCSRRRRRSANIKAGSSRLWKGEHDCPMGELPPGTPIYVSEGIEDGLSVALARPSLRVIAAISLSNLGALELPPQCPIYILGQRDEKMRAIEAFASAVAKLQDKGHDVFLIYPPQGVKDYNELLQRDGAHAAEWGEQWRT
jgi:hypothetical protein